MPVALLVFDGQRAVLAESRAEPGSQSLQLYDVVLLAHHFQVSRKALLHRLRNLHLLSEVERDRFLAEDGNGEGRALARLMPEVDRLFGVPQRADYHPEIDTGVHTGMVLDMAARLAPGNALVGWCALTHDLGKALTPADKLPSHPAHEHAGVAPVDALCTRLKVPNEYAVLAGLVCRLHLLAHTALQLRPATVLGLFEQLDAFRKTMAAP